MTTIQKLTTAWATSLVLGLLLPLASSGTVPSITSGSLIRPLRSATALATVTNQYDLNGNRTNLVYPGGLRVGYRYGADNRLTEVTTRYAGQTNLFGFSYDTANRLTRIACPNGVTSTFSYDAEGRVTNIVHASTAAGGPFASRRIARNALGFKEADGIDAGIVPTLPGMARRLRTHNAADQLVAESLQTDTTNPIPDRDDLCVVLSLSAQVVCPCPPPPAKAGTPALCCTGEGKGE